MNVVADVHKMRSEIIGLLKARLFRKHNVLLVIIRHRYADTTPKRFERADAKIPPAPQSNKSRIDQPDPEATNDQYCLC